MSGLPPASRRGFDRAGEITDQFGTDLLDEAGRVARRYGSEEASPEHVNTAAEHLYRSGRRRGSDVAVAAGGVIAGIGGSAIVAFLQANKINGLQVGAAVAAMALGLVILMWGLFRQ